MNNDSIILKCLKVIESCETLEHLGTALRYTNRACLLIESNRQRTLLMGKLDDKRLTLVG